MMMMMGDSLALGVEGGPVSSMNYKRALLRSPPREFTIEVLSPVKYGNNWSFGLKVCPIVRFKRGSDTHSMSSHSSSTSSYSEYDIWRRWEDCLDFQETLEAEYGKMSRQKVKVLRRGATSKKKEDDGPYTIHNAAASFESLPEGPDPREVAVDVHDLIPPLTRKGTLFRVSRNTVKQRGEEFAAMVRALFNASDEAPVLLQELRNCTPVRDFFGFWRRDKDIQKKAAKPGSMFHSNQSLSSLRSTPSSPAFSTFSAAPRTPTSPFEHHTFTVPGSGVTSDSTRDARSPAPLTPASAPPGGRTSAPRFLRPTQSSVSLQHDRFRTNGDMTESSILFTDEMLLEDDSGPSAESAPKFSPVPRVSTPLSAPVWGSGSTRVTEVQITRSPRPRVPDPIPEEVLPLRLPRMRSNSGAAPGNRNGRIFTSPPLYALPSTPEEHVHPNVQAAQRHPADGHETTLRHTYPNDQPPDLVPRFSPSTSSHSTSPSSRLSSISLTRFSITSSISSYIHTFSKRSNPSRDSRQSFESDASVELDLPYIDSPIIPHTPLSEVAEYDGQDYFHNPRDSFASFASGRTDSSAEAVIPRHLRVSMAYKRQRSLSLESRSDSRTPVMDGGKATALLEESRSDGGDDLLDSYFDERTTIPQLTKETSEKELPRLMSHKTQTSIGSISSIGSSNESSMQWSHDAFAVKALYRDSVVVFRAERSMPLTIIRQRIQDKFVLHESVPLERDFVLAYLPSRVPVMKAGMVANRRRSNSATSSTADLSQLRLLKSEVDWQSAITICGGKVTLRVLDAEALY